MLEFAASSGPNDQGQEESIISQAVRELANTENTIYTQPVFDSDKHIKLFNS